ncbi:MAG: divergent polysaccharide deacetylase family protein [Sulfuricurvum sp.]|nr:divergent polysaccharide deacetylase family protein [Sulfuricurvum sp.]
MGKRSLSPKSSFLKWFGLSLIGIILFVIALFIGYFIGFNQAEDELDAERLKTRHLAEQIQQIASIDEYNQPLSKAKDKSYDGEIAQLQRELQKLLDRERPSEIVKPQHEYAPKGTKVLPPPAVERPVCPTGSAARLVIIIDDVSYARDVKAIQSTGLPLVMSFLPPSSRHGDSAILAQQQKTYMVHLPLEALDYDAEEPSTLRIGDSEETISKRINALRCQFPNARYYNNHTGSKFTSDTAAMERLLHVFQKEGLKFVDSRTTPKSKVPAVSEAFGIHYVGRDVFLDHQDGVDNVKKQIKEAVDKAKRHGVAIAIGHPRPDTIQALKESKELLGEVQLIGIEQI